MPSDSTVCVDLTDDHDVKEMLDDWREAAAFAPAGHPPARLQVPPPPFLHACVRVRAACAASGRCPHRMPWVYLLKQVDQAVHPSDKLYPIRQVCF